jgi:DNA-binding response OmpR family regulator
MQSASIQRAILQKLLIMVLTARADLELLFRDFHVDGVIIKPFEASRLFKEVEIILNKHYWKKTDGSGKRVVIVEDVYESAKKISAVFSSAGYKTEIATSGVSAIEQMMADPPDLSVVKLGLLDIPGDKVISRLQQIARTKKTSSLLYIPKSTEHDKIEMEKISDIKGIKNRLEYNNPVELLNAANGIFEEMGKSSLN